MQKEKLSFRKKLSLNIFTRYVDVQSKLHELSYFFWECTVRCNINCLHCGSDCRSDSTFKDMPADDFLAVTRKVATKYNPNKVMIVITGGEPLLRKDLEYTGLELYKQGYPWGIVTNGYAMTPQRFRSLMDAGMRSITVSLDGFEDSHNWLRGNRNSFRKAVSAIELIVKEKDLVYDVVTCVNQKNINELPDLNNFLAGMGVKKWRVFTICPIGRAKENPDLNISDQQFKQILDFIKAARKNGKIQTSYSCEGYLGNYEGEVRDGFFFCRAGINIGSILADGSICACPNIDHRFIQGNIYKDDFLDVWENRFQSMRNREWTKDGICKDCEVFRYCRGNGIHLRDLDKHDVMRCHYKMLNKV